MNASTPSNSLTPGKDKDKKKRKKKPHQTSENSIKAYREIRKEGLIDRQADRAIKLLAIHQPITTRRLSQISGIEKTAMCRVLFNAVKAGTVKIAFSDLCETTKKTVGYYSLSSYKIEKSEVVCSII